MSERVGLLKSLGVVSVQPREEDGQRRGTHDAAEFFFSVAMTKIAAIGLGKPSTGSAKFRHRI